MSGSRGAKAGAGAPVPKATMRGSLIGAAFELFLERGYDQTTVDDIVALAGVGRRSFFRYFPSKEDVVFPDHEGRLAEVMAFLSSGDDEDDPFERIRAAAMLVARMYAENPTFSVQRYRLTKAVTGLSVYERSVVGRYERAFADFLRVRFADRREGDLRAAVIAAAVVAAHNTAVRSWLRSGGVGDVLAEVDQALGYVHHTFAPDAGGAGEETEDVVVVISRRRVPMWRVVHEIETALRGE
ncbi:MAG: TetR family transcriptional regulator [Actinoallomurus sp.]